MVTRPSLSFLASTVVGLSKHLSSLPRGAVFRVSHVSLLPLDLPSTSPSYALQFFWDSTFFGSSTPQTLLPSQLIPGWWLSSAPGGKTSLQVCTEQTFTLCMLAGQTLVTVRRRKHFTALHATALRVPNIKPWALCVKHLTHLSA